MILWGHEYIICCSSIHWQTKFILSQIFQRNHIVSDLLIKRTLLLVPTNSITKGTGGAHFGSCTDDLSCSIIFKKKNQWSCEKLAQSDLCRCLIQFSISIESSTYTYRIELILHGPIWFFLKIIEWFGSSMRDLEWAPRACLLSNGMWVVGPLQLYRFNKTLYENTRDTIILTTPAYLTLYDWWLQNSFKVMMEK